jgi:hypothetical protein
MTVSSHPMSLLLRTLLPPPWNYYAAVMPVAGFVAGRWLLQRLCPSRDR